MHMADQSYGSMLACNPAFENAAGKNAGIALICILLMFCYASASSQARDHAWVPKLISQIT